MKVLLVNPNRYASPPVIPVGLEHLTGPLERAGHSVALCDLTFCDAPDTGLVRGIDEERPDVIGFTVRNVDTAMFGDNRFFLDDVARLVGLAREHAGVPIVAGGAATLCSREPLRAFLGVDHLVAGPGEVALPALLEALGAQAGPPAVIDGWAHGIDAGAVHRRGDFVDYGSYLEGGNPSGLEYRKGCGWNCPFCVERLSPVLAREVDAVLAEARALVDLGVEMFCFCDNEVNQDLEGTNTFLQALAEAELPLRWTGYFRARPADTRMAALTAQSGCSTLTLSVMSGELSGPDGQYDSRDVREFIEMFKGAGMKVSVDLLVGYPGESQGSIERAFALLADAGPDTVGVYHVIRLYSGTPVSETARTSGRGRLMGALADNAHLLKPLFYCEVDEQWLRSQVAADARFFLAGEEQRVNYQLTAPASEVPKD